MLSGTLDSSAEAVWGIRHSKTSSTPAVYPDSVSVSILPSFPYFYPILLHLLLLILLLTDSRTHYFQVTTLLPTIIPNT